MFNDDILAASSGSSTIPVVVEDDDGFDPLALKRAVVILHAAWSGPSNACIQLLAELSVSTAEQWLYIVNIDKVSPDWQEKHFGGVAQGM